MFISKEIAKDIARKSYSLFEMGKADEYITYKKALEFDEITGKKVLLDIEERLKIVKMNEEAKALGAKLHYADDEIITIDNYQYIESVSYEVVESDQVIKSTSDEVRAINVKMLGGESIDIPNLNYFLAPHIYGHMLRGQYKNHDYPRILDPSMRVVFLKAIVAEDRRVNPYVLREFDTGDKYRYFYCFPMEEALRETIGFDDEIELLNDLFKITNGRFFSEGKLGGYADISIKATVLYLEGIDEIDLANKFREYGKDEKYQYLNMVISYAEEGCYGITFNGKRRQVKLL